jgi:anti-sigma regulatory factor (Ser/Thr protein kinase)
LDEASVSEARQRVRELGASIGMPDVAVASLVTAASELGHNQLRHATRGAIGLSTIVDDLGVAGLEIVAADEGPGIAEPARALAGGGSTKGGLGIGLAGVFELADEVDIDVRLGEGTCIRARKFPNALSRRREVAVIGRPISGERVSGDDAAFARLGDGSLLLALADGLGHGPEARIAATAAVDEVLGEPSRALDRALLAAHAAVAKTRGAVMTLASIDRSGALATASVGNTTAEIVGRGGARRFGGQSWVLGQTARAGTITVERDLVGPRDGVVLFSDGLSSRLGLEGIEDLLHERAIVVADALLARYGKSHDDALIIVAR